MSWTHRVARAWLAACLLATASLPALAQEATLEPGSEQPPLLEMLALAPAIPETRAGVPFLSYVDYRAIEQARPDVPVFESWDAFNTVAEANDLDIRLWWQNNNRIQAGPGFYVAYMLEFENTEALVGFDIFDIDRALLMGEAPDYGVVLQGDFDVEAVTEAFLARGYTAGQNNGVVLLNRADGEPGSAIDFQNIDPANPFGGPLGRREPVAVTATYLLNSPGDALLEAMVNAYVGYRPSLYTQPDLTAAAEALSVGQGQLLQAQFLNPADVATPMSAEAAPDNGYGPLPPYQLAVLADLEDGADQVALVALVYDDEATARTAAEELSARLPVFSHPNTHRPLIELVEGAHVAEPNVYYSPGTGNYVALASVRYPMPTNTVVDLSTGQPIPEGQTADRPGFLMSGQLFRLWNMSLQQRTFDLLTVTE